VVGFILISISECVTKRESRFKEAFIAFLSLPEVGSWICFIAFTMYRVGAIGPTLLAAIALLMYAVINLAHAIIHPRKMVPHTLFSYKTLVNEHKCSTMFFRIVSYLISFKFSLILVSYFWLRPKFKGDYSALNWKQFNRFSLAFIFMPYPMMMFACCYFLVTDGFFSYPGFVAVEVIALSTTLAILMLLDALSSIKCRTVGKSKTNKAIRVATGADYESEDEKPHKRAVKRQLKTRDIDDFGDEDSYGSEASKDRMLKNMESSHYSKIYENSVQTQVMDEETKRQIAMLEELAQTMKVEKEQLRMEKERLARERALIQQDKDEHIHQMERYMSDYNEQTNALSRQVKDLENQKTMLVTKVEEKLEEGALANEQLLASIKQAQIESQKAANRKNYKDVEAEMEDYEPVEEESGEHESEAEVVDPA